MERDELSAWLRLTLTEGIGTHSARRLLACFGSAPAIFAQRPEALAQVVSARQAEALQHAPLDLAAQRHRTEHWLDTPAPGTEHAVWTLGDPAYPAAFLQLSDPPLLVYAQGRGVRDPASSRVQAAVAIVGSRNPTHQGQHTARQMAQALASAGLCVVSGLALGIDGAAHQGALDALAEQPRGAHAGPCTVAVVGTGLDRVYPRQHAALAQAVAHHGVVLSECPLGAPPLAAHFPRRNRLIAALAQGTLVVEAALHSGSLITAELALGLGREVMAMPGSIHAPQSRGCHALLRQGATLVENAQDVLDALRLPAQTAPSIALATPAPSDDDALLACMGFDPVHLDALQARSAMDTATLQARLLTLELDQRIGRLPGGLFQRLG